MLQHTQVAMGNVIEFAREGAGQSKRTTAGSNKQYGKRKFEKKIKRPGKDWERGDDKVEKKRRD